MELKTREEKIRDYVQNGFRQLIAFGDIKSISPEEDCWELTNPEYVAFVKRHIMALIELLPREEQLKVLADIVNKESE